jgi:hypothetical protein
MKITNKTHYDTESLRRLFTACLQEVQKTEKNPVISHPKVTVVYKRGGQSWVGGYAYYNSGTIKMKLPKAWKARIGLYITTLDSESFQDFSRKIADTFIHELGHCIGIHHKRTPDMWGLQTIERAYQGWLKENVDSARFPIPIQEKPKASKEDLTAKRYTKALGGLNRASRRLKRAQTLFKKWTAKVRYYERSQARAKTIDKT